MATVEANKAIIVIAKEAIYGTAITIPTFKCPDMMEYSFGVGQIAVPQKTQTLEPKIKTSQEGRKSPTVTLSGILTYDHSILLNGFFGKSGTPYVWQTADSNYSYTIAQAIPASSSDLGDGVLATGCRLETLEISKNGDYVGYTATFRAKTIDDMVDFNTYTLTSITDTSYPELTPFLWQDVTCSLVDTQAITKMNTFSLTLTNTFMDDDAAFQNTQTKIRDYVCESSGVLTAEWIYDTIKDAGVYDNLLSQTTNTDIITLVDSVTVGNTWAITTEGQYTDYQKPDKEKCLYAGSFAKQLMGDGSNTAISIAVTS